MNIFISMLMLQIFGSQVVDPPGGAISYNFAEEPVVVAMEVVHGAAPIIFAKVNGVTKRLVVASDTPFSYLFVPTKDQQGEETDEIEIGGYRFTSKEKLYCNIDLQATWREPGTGEHTDKLVDGIIGISDLKKLAVGIDYFEQKVTFWPKGNLSENDAKNWVSGLSPIPTSGPVGGVRKINVAESVDGLFTVSAVIDSNKAEFILGTGFGDLTCFRENAPRHTSEIEVQRLADGEVLSYRLSEDGDASLFGTKFCTLHTSTYAKPSEDNHPALSTLGMLNFNSRRILIDFPSKQMFLEPTNEQLAKSMLLSNLLNMTVRIDKGHLYLGPFPKVRGLQNLAVVEGCEVKSIGDLQADEIVQSILSDEIGSMRHLVSLARAIKKGPVDAQVIYDGDLQIVRIGGSEVVPL